LSLHVLLPEINKVKSPELARKMYHETRFLYGLDWSILNFLIKSSYNLFLTKIPLPNFVKNRICPFPGSSGGIANFMIKYCFLYFSLPGGEERGKDIVFIN
jgi:hypothetical protein